MSHGKLLEQCLSSHKHPMRFAVTSLILLFCLGLVQHRLGLRRRAQEKEGQHFCLWSLGVCLLAVMGGGWDEGLMEPESYPRHFLPNRLSMKSETTLTLSFTSLLSRD